MDIIGSAPFSPAEHGLLDLAAEISRHVVMHLEHGVLHLFLRSLAVDRVDDVEPEIVGKPDLGAARLEDTGDALVLARLIKQDQEIGLDRDLEQRSGLLAEFLRDLAPDLGTVL